MWTRNYADEQKAAIDTINQRRRLKAIRAAREAKAAAKESQR